MMNKENKRSYIEEMKKNFTSNDSVMIAQYQGLNVNELDELRKQLREKGGTMRLGAYPCSIQKNSKLYTIYQQDEISERHRHRYEFNNEYKSLFEEHGIKFSGLSPDGELVEVIELIDHPWFIACQFHPEFKSRPYKAHPLFYDFIKETLALNVKPS